MRGSVHIQLPKISKDMPRFKKIAVEFYVQIRGIHGEHLKVTTAFTTSQTSADLAALRKTSSKTCTTALRL